VVAEPTGATGSAEDEAFADLVQAATSSTTESSAWVLVIFLATLGGVVWYLWCGAGAGELITVEPVVGKRPRTPVLTRVRGLGC
jgi:hypothetical protein